MLAQLVDAATVPRPCGFRRDRDRAVVIGEGLGVIAEAQKYEAATVLDLRIEDRPFPCTFEGIVAVLQRKRQVAARQRARPTAPVQRIRDTPIVPMGCDPEIKLLNARAQAIDTLVAL